MKNKRGFEMIWSTWVIMILAFMLLLFLVLFFTGSAKGFLDNVKGYFTKTNVDSVIKGCNILSDSDARFEFCCDRKNVIYLIDGDKKEGKFTCFQLMNKTFINNEIRSNIKCEEVGCE